MGDILVKQTLSLTAGAASNPTATSDFSFDRKTFDLVPAELFESVSFNETVCGNFSIPTATVDLSIGMGTIQTGKLLYIKPESDLDVKIVNSNGTSQNITVLGGGPSVLHIQFTDILVSNSGATSIKGDYLIAGD